VSKALIGVIDDDDALCSSVVDLMRSVGHRAQPFHSVEAFLASPDQVLFHCLVADVQLPGMSPVDLVRQLRQQSNPIPIILMTARPNRDLEQAARAAGAACILTKPFDAAVLLDWVEKSLTSTLRGQ